jgi:hypothetical protein
LETAAFAVSYKVNAAGAGGLLSEVYLNPEYHYPHGYSVAIEPSGCCYWSTASKVLMMIRCACFACTACLVLTGDVSHAPTVAPGTEISVSITANAQ